MIDRASCQRHIANYQDSYRRAGGSRRSRLDAIAQRIDTAIATATWNPTAPDGERIAFTPGNLSAVVERFYRASDDVQLALWDRLGRALIANDDAATPQTERTLTVTIELAVRLKRSRGLSLLCDRDGTLRIA